jgi:type IV pilus assembly protein PilB
LRKLSVPNVSVVTLEEPVEYSIPETTQIPIQHASHMTFASALRSVLRQDPDIIMVGEIRDTATAELSVHAALTGHLLLSTLHTNDAVTTIPRLIDMGVEPFLIASTLRAVVSQRLVRKICSACKTERTPSKSEIDFLIKNEAKIDIEKVRLYHGRGCVQCRNTGYMGRIVIAETLLPTAEFKNAIVDRAQAESLRSIAVAGGMVSIRIDAVSKVLAGITTINEIAFSEI